MLSWTAGVVIISYASPYSLPLGRAWPPGHVQIPSPSPGLRAFTFYSQAGSASRLDSMWWLPCPQVEVQLLNAAILCQWDRRVDHDPVLWTSPYTYRKRPNSPSVSTPWRSLVRRLDGDLPVSIATRAEEHSQHIAQLATELDSLGVPVAHFPAPAF